MFSTHNYATIREGPEGSGRKNFNFRTQARIRLGGKNN